MSRPNTTPAIAPQSGPLGLRAGLRFGDPDVGTQLARLHAEFGQFLSCANGAVVSAQLDLAKARKFKTEADTESERLNKRIKQLEEDGDEEKKALKTEIEDLKTKNEKLKLRFKKFRESMNFDDLDL
jgi:gas vesicle protein